LQAAQDQTESVSMTLKIRPLERADEADWRRLFTAYLAFYETSVAEEVYVSSFERLFSDKDTEFNALIAVVEGQAVGLTHFLFHRHMWKVETVCYLQDLYVDPSVRGTGAGRALIQAVYDAADQAGSPTVYWLTQDFNHTARKLYDRIGTLSPFIKYGRS
jgi:GNAT superfamily N-acetyltransferase